MSISGGGDNSQVTTTHISIFQINEKPIKAESTEPLMINEGDEVLVAGSISKGIFNGLAYKNLTTHAEGNEGWLLMLFFGIVFPIVGLFCVMFLDIFFKIIGSVFLGAGIYALLRGIRVMQATNALRQEAP